MTTFQELWHNHPGRKMVCDEAVFQNQCAMRMGDALAKSRVVIPMQGLRTCVGYNKKRFEKHQPGHIRSAHQLAELLKTRPKLLGAATHLHVLKGTIADNLSQVSKMKGVLFIMNGWGSTDHIDVWSGSALKGGDSSYFDKGSETWVWDLS
tara:strand:- start:5444 stop:5896 length:453 start_codon:yes stop_codon:yes gene_type:complete